MTAFTLGECHRVRGSDRINYLYPRAGETASVSDRPIVREAPKSHSAVFDNLHKHSQAGHLDPNFVC